MKRFSLLFAIVLIVSLLAACVPPTAPAAPAAAPAAEEKAAPAAEAPAEKEPTVFRYPLTSDPEGTLEPGLVLALNTSKVSENLHAGLLKYDHETNLVPYLAESYEISEDGKTYTFYLREDAKWHNGRGIVASDFKKGWERYLDPQLAAQAALDYLGSIVGAEAMMNGETTELAGVEVVDDYTLKITTVEPTPGFLLKIATSPSWIVPPESVVEGEPQWVDGPVGAGPFKFVEWKTNEKIVLEAFDDFFLGRPSLDRIEFLVVPDEGTALAMYEAGELDIADVPASDLTRLTEDPVLSQELLYRTRAQLVYFGLNMYKVPEFQDVRVRLAFNHALNRAQITEKLLFNRWAPAKGLVPPGIPEHNPDLAGYEYNPELAQQLMAEAGFPGGAGFPALKISSIGNYSTQIEAFAAQINENLGTNIEVAVLERGEHIKGLWDHETHDIFYWGWTADFPSAEVWTHQLLHGGLDSNFFGYDNPEFDAIVDAARITMDEAERISLWQQAEKIAIAEGAMVPFGYSQYIWLVKPYVEGFTFNLNGPEWLYDIVINK